DAASFLLQEGTGAAEPEEAAPVATRPRPIEPPERPQRAVTPRPRPAAPLPPLRSNETPDWLRHLHWLLALAMIPLAVSLLTPSESPEEVQKRRAETLKDVPLEAQLRFLQDLKDGKASPEDVYSILPEQKWNGAFLSRKTMMHWVMAAGAAVL